MSSSSSSNRSSTIPLSFERFRIRSFHFISLFSSSHSNKTSTTTVSTTKQNIERSCSRKTKVQPHSIEPSQQKLNPSAAHLFYANDNLPAGRSYSLTEDLYRTGIEQRRSDMVKTLDTNKTLKNMNQAWQTNLSDLPCPSTPLMIHYRRDSLPMDIPKRIIAPPPPRSRSRSKKDNHIEQIDSN